MNANIYNNKIKNLLNNTMNGIDNIISNFVITDHNYNDYDSQIDSDNITDVNNAPINNIENGLIKKKKRYKLTK